ncbi:MAG: phosphatidylinositol kinase [Acidobacteriia bacterium]|nr:phosphatidylinositol kinase [Terriglobia bacterium]
MGEPGEGPSAERAEAFRLRAVEFVRRMRGASQPSLLRCEDGASYVVKFRNNPQHVRVLANEMLAGRLALLIGLSVPRPTVVDVPPELIAASPLLQFELGTRREPCAAGLQFGSRFPGVPGRTLVVDFLPDRLLKDVVKKEPGCFLGALVFDKWTCNCDGRQVIFYRLQDREGSSYSTTLIDHGFCFNDGDWNFPDSPIRSLYPRRMVYGGVRGLDSFEPFLSRVENLEASDLADCVRGIPEEWCGEQPEELTRLVERLYERRRRVRQALIEARDSSLAPFPNWR